MSQPSPPPSATTLCSRCGSHHRRLQTLSGHVAARRKPSLRLCEYKSCSCASVDGNQVVKPSGASAKGDNAVAILDGGMGHQLKAMGIEITGKVGSMRRFLGVAVANVEQSDMVTAAHLAFVDAGAEIIITNNYACVPKCLDQRPDDMASVGLEELVAAAGRCARRACELRPNRKVTVAGSLPPLAESYRPDLVGPFEQNVEQYKIIAKSIAPFSDVIVCETMSRADEARAAVTAAAGEGLPIWVSWTMHDVMPYGKPVLRSGESIEAAFEAVRSVPGAKLEACLFNCSSPEITTVALPILREIAPDLKIGAYANGFVVDNFMGKDGEYRDLSPKEYCWDFAANWEASGATIIGGCCGIFPPHISYLSQNMK